MSNTPNATPITVQAPMLVTTQQAAPLMALCEKTIRNLVKRGELRAVRCGRALRIDPRDITAWIDRQKGGTPCTPR
jgi:excisionase family DNA binding protein